MSDEQRISSITQVKPGDFMKQSGKDKAGKWSYVGEVDEVNMETLMVYMKTTIGRLGFHVKSFSEETLTLTDKPTGWDKFVKNPDKFKEKQVEKEQKKIEAAQVPVVKTLKEQVFTLVIDNMGLSEAKMLKVIKAAVKGDDNLINNYMQIARARLAKAS